MLQYTLVVLLTKEVACYTLAMNTPRTTKKQQALLTFVSDFITEHTYGPSYREIMSGLGYKSVSTVAVHVDALIAKGFLRRGQDAVRSLEIVESGDQHASQPTPSIVSLIEQKLPDTTQEEKETLLLALTILGYEKESARLRHQKHTA